MSLSEGDRAPDFDVVDTQGKRHHLEALVGQGAVVLAFFPKAGTPVCRREMQAYQGIHAELAAQGAHLIAVSGDKEARQEDFRQEVGADFAFVADPAGTLMRLYGVKLPLIAFARRTTFVIGRDRKVLKIDRGSDAATVDGVAAACSLFGSKT